MKLQNYRIAELQNCRIRKRGSALLIVLGMLSFMVISAVSFSIYMRQSRSPSSYLRRSISSRYLTRAALARAMDEIDVLIGNDPYPGVGNNANEGRDCWQQRVLCPRTIVNDNDYPDKKFTDAPYYNKTYNNSNDTGTYPDMADTESVLTLEALGYLPPALINNVRYWSRRTATARWKSFNYDAGRWAFCAVNVSDMLDINQIRTLSRGASANRRVSLGFLFENQSHNGLISAPSPDTFRNDFLLPSTRPGATVETLNDQGSVKAKVPFASMMDFNLMLGYKNYSELPSPFYQYINGSAQDLFDSSRGSNISNLMFVTDSYLPSHSTAGNSTTNYLSNVTDMANHLPFYNLLNTARTTYTPHPIADILNDGGASEDIRALGDAISPLLYDYLDPDSVPVSLALPCTEMTPMIAALSLADSGEGIRIKPDFVKGETKTEEGGEGVSVTKTIFKLNGIEVRAPIQVGVVFPFKRADERLANKNFTVQVLVRVFFSRVPGTTWGYPCRFEYDTSASQLVPFSKNDWKNGEVKKDSNDILYATFMGQKSFNVNPENVTRMDNGDLIQELAVNVSGNVSFGGDEANVFTYQVTKTKGDPEKGIASKEEKAVLSGDGNNPCRFRCYDTNGKPVAPVTTGDGATQVFHFSGDANDPEVQMTAVVVARITDSDNNTVDLVPATLNSDNGYNNVNNERYAQRHFQWSGDGLAALPVRSTCNFVTSLSAIETASGGNPSDLLKEGGTPQEAPHTWACCDPRFNYAPENLFFIKESSTTPGKDWLDMIRGNKGPTAILGENGRDSDVFMFVSNQGRLQSVGELAFLPRCVTGNLKYFTSAANNSTSTAHDTYDFESVNFPGTGTIWPADEQNIFQSFGDGNIGVSKVVQGNFMWRTFHMYPPKGYGANDHDHIFDIAFGDHRILDDDGSGYKISPFADEENIKRLVLANTPFDFWAACTNRNDKISAVHPATLKYSESLELTFSEHSSPFKSETRNLKWDDLKIIADEMRVGFEECAKDGGDSEDWKKHYDELDWYEGIDPKNEASFKNLFGKTLQGSTYLHEVDRKYLHAFWRGCFGNNQQLFLVFVRAEPSTAGASQLGGRAVALVWRDPQAPVNQGNQDQDNSRQWMSTNFVRDRNDFAPHQMRVLFYHQFE